MKFNHGAALIALGIFIVALLMISMGPMEETMSQETKQPQEHTNTKKAVFAGGCFWCSESDFEKHEGVIAVISGYTGGGEEDPTYKQVASGRTTHVEGIEVTYDPSKVTYEELLDVFWRHVDPTDAGGQFVDRGAQYRTAIFYADEEQKQLAEKSKAELDASGRYDKPIVTEIRPLTIFYPAEEYHQDYYKKNPTHYKLYRYHSGRDQYIESTWGDSEEQ